MYPGPIFKWHDQSAMQTQSEAVVVENRPLFLAAASFDRGPEDMRVVSDDFYNLYGTKIDFAKHGQPAIQVKNIIDNGGSVLLKRVVADDAALANVILVATINIDLTAKPAAADEDGKTIKEITGSGDDTTKYVVTSASTLKWTAVSVAGTSSAPVKSFDAVITKMADLVKTPEYTVDDSDPAAVKITAQADYPIMAIGDNGRGVSSKSVRITPDYNGSKNIANFFYAAVIYDGTELLGNALASFDQNTYLNGVNYGFNEYTTPQVKFYVDEAQFANYLAEICVLTGISEDDIHNYDVIFAKTVRQDNIPGLSLSADSIDLATTYGVSLQNGSNGAFGDAPFGKAEYDAQLVNFFNGTFDDAIFDLDQYKIAAVFDANYSISVKEAIAGLVNFRQDCFFFRDLGVAVKTYASIEDALNSLTTSSFFIGDYLTTYDIYDPNNGKRIKVTCMYDLAAVMVNHFSTGAFNPIAGIANNIILESAIEGTINFVPRITPKINQKDLLDDIKCNYAVFDQDTRQCVMQSLYTSQNANTQLSYINNVLAIQEVARAVRSSCPKNRYTFASGIDFTAYATDVSNVLANYKSNFEQLEFEYTQNAVYAMQKIFAASIKFRFNNWAQTEYFDLYALPNEYAEETLETV